MITKDPQGRYAHLMSPDEPGEQSEHNEAARLISALRREVVTSRMALDHEKDAHGKTQLALDEAVAMKDAAGQKAHQLAVDLKLLQVRVEIATRLLPHAPARALGVLQGEDPPETDLKELDPG